MGLNAISGGRRTPANDQEKWTFEFDRVHALVSTIAVLIGDSSFFSRCKFSRSPSAGIQWGGRVGLSSVPHGKLVAYKSYI